MRGFQCIGGGNAPAHTELPHVALGDALKGASPGLDKGVHAFISLVSSLHCVGKCVAWIQ